MLTSEKAASAPGHSCRSCRATLCNLNWALWANVFFFVGSVLWLLSALACWRSDESSVWCNVYAAAACACYLIMGPLYLEQWRCDRAYDDEVLFGGGAALLKNHSQWNQVLQRVERIDFVFWSLATFQLGVVGDVGNTILEALEENDWIDGSLHLADIVDVFASHMWILSGLLGAVHVLLDARARNAHEARYRYTLNIMRSGCTFRTAIAPERDNENEVVYIFDWEGLGEILFVPGGVCYGIGSYTCWFSNLHWCYIFQTAGAIFFLLDSLLYFPGILIARYHREWRENSTHMTDA